MNLPTNRSQSEALEFLLADDELVADEDMGVEEAAMHIDDPRSLERELEVTPADLAAQGPPTSWFDDEEPEDRGGGYRPVRHGSTTPSVQDLLVSQHYAFVQEGEQEESVAPRMLHLRTTWNLRSERDSLRALLPKLRAHLDSERAEELSPSDQHQADVATETYEQEKDISVLAELTERLRAIEEEIERRG